MLRLLFVILLVWPFLLPPGICACSLTEADWFSDDSASAPTDSHDEADHDADCPGAKKTFVTRTTPDVADALSSVVVLPTFSLPFPSAESVSADCNPDHLPRSEPFYILLCALLI